MNHSPTPLHCALKQCCPACGEGKLFTGLLAIAPRCDHCQLDLQAHEKGDGPAFFVITLVGFLVVGLAALTESIVSLPGWAHALIWIPFILLSSLYFLRVFKAAIVSVQYRHMGIR